MSNASSIQERTFPGSAGSREDEIVLVTGAGGFIGSHLVENQLRRGRRVRALDLRFDALGAIRSDRLERIVADVTDGDAMARATAGTDVLYHLASKHLEVGIPDAEYRRVNVEGTRRLLECAERGGVRRFVYCSTTGLMGSILHPPADEDAPARPDMIYERTKWEAEQVVRGFAAGSRMEVVIVRPAWVYGPRCPRTEKLLRQVAKGRFLMVGSGRCLRHPVYIEDMCAGFHLAGTVPAAAGRTYIIAGERAVSVRALVEAAGAAVGVPVRVLTLPVPAAALLFRLVEATFVALRRRPPISSRSLKFFTQQTCFDLSRARRELGFAPAVPLDEGLRRTWEAMVGATRRTGEGEPALAPPSSPAEVPAANAAGPPGAGKS